MSVWCQQGYAPPQAQPPVQWAPGVGQPNVVPRTEQQPQPGYPPVGQAGSAHPHLQQQQQQQQPQQQGTAPVQAAHQQYPQPPAPHQQQPPPLGYPGPAGQQPQQPQQQHPSAHPQEQVPQQQHQHQHQQQHQPQMPGYSQPAAPQPQYPAPPQQSSADVHAATGQHHQHQHQPQQYHQDQPPAPQQHYQQQQHQQQPTVPQQVPTGYAPAAWQPPAPPQPMPSTATAPPQPRGQEHPHPQGTVHPAQAAHAQQYPQPHAAYEPDGRQLTASRPNEYQPPTAGSVYAPQSPEARQHPLPRHGHNQHELQPPVSGAGGGPPPPPQAQQQPRVSGEAQGVGQVGASGPNVYLPGSQQQAHMPGGYSQHPQPGCNAPQGGQQAGSEPQCPPPQVGGVQGGEGASPPVMHPSSVAPGAGQRGSIASYGAAVGQPHISVPQQGPPPGYGAGVGQVPAPQPATQPHIPASQQQHNTVAPGVGGQPTSVAPGYQQQPQPGHPPVGQAGSSHPHPQQQQQQQQPQQQGTAPVQAAHQQYPQPPAPHQQQQQSLPPGYGASVGQTLAPQSHEHQQGVMYPGPAGQQPQQPQQQHPSAHPQEQVPQQQHQHQHQQQHQPQMPGYSQPAAPQPQYPAPPQQPSADVHAATGQHHQHQHQPQQYHQDQPPAPQQHYQQQQHQQQPTVPQQVPTGYAPAAWQPPAPPQPMPSTATAPAPAGPVASLPAQQPAPTQQHTQPPGVDISAAPAQVAHACDAPSPGQEAPQPDTAACAAEDDTASGPPPATGTDKTNPHAARDALLSMLRPYQTEMFDKCCNRNTLAVMPTGTGKTLVAFAVTEHRRVHVLETTGVAKPVLLLFRTKSLCSQQFLECRALFKKIGKSDDIRIGSLLNHDLSLNEHTDATDIQQYQYIFGLASVVLNNYLQVGTPSGKIESFSCIVFDEAHNVRRDSAEVKILQNHVKTVPEGERPQILGLTATPFGKKTTAKTEMDALCSVLDARIVTPEAPEHVRSMLEYASQAPPQIETVPYTAAEERLISYTGDALEMLLNTLPEFENSENYTHTSHHNILASIIEKRDWNADSTQSLENAVGLDLPLRKLCNLNSAVHKVEVIAQKSGVLAAKEYWSECCRTTLAHKPTQDASNPQLEEEWGIVRERTERIEAELRKTFASTSAHDKYGSKEHAVLKELLREYNTHGDKMRVIVFVPMVAAVSSMARRFTAILKAEGPDMLQAPHVVAEYTHKTRSTAGDTIRQGFKKGHHKIIFSTTALEEGIDIPNCSLVVRFYMQSFSIIALNQCRGRARKTGARFVLFVDSADEKEQAEKHLDYEYVMNVTRDHTIHAPESMEAGVPYDERLNAERLVAYYCQEMISSRNAAVMPTIDMCLSDTSVRTMTLTLPVVGLQDGRVFSVTSAEKEVRVKFQLMKDACKYLDVRGLLKPVPSAEFRETFEVREYQTQTTACGKGDGDLQVYDSDTWGHKLTPYDQLLEQCGVTLGVTCAHKLEGMAHFVTICISGRGKPCSYENPGVEGRGHSTYEHALHNSALVALRDFFRFNFYRDDAPKHLLGIVPETRETSQLSISDSYNPREKRMESILCVSGPHRHDESQPRALYGNRESDAYSRQLGRRPFGGVDRRQQYTEYTQDYKTAAGSQVRGTQHELVSRPQTQPEPCDKQGDGARGQRAASELGPGAGGQHHLPPGYGAGVGQPVPQPQQQDTAGQDGAGQQQPHQQAGTVQQQPQQGPPPGYGAGVGQVPAPQPATQPHIPAPQQQHNTAAPGVGGQPTSVAPGYQQQPQPGHPPVGQAGSSHPHPQQQQQQQQPQQQGTAPVQAAHQQYPQPPAPHQQQQQSLPPGYGASVGQTLAPQSHEHQQGVVYPGPAGQQPQQPQQQHPSAHPQEQVPQQQHQHQQQHQPQMPGYSQPAAPQPQYPAPPQQPSADVHAATGQHHQHQHQPQQYHQDQPPAPQQHYQQQQHQQQPTVPQQVPTGYAPAAWQPPAPPQPMPSTGTEPAPAAENPAPMQATAWPNPYRT